MAKLRQKTKYKDVGYSRILKSKDSSDSGDETELFVINKSPRKEIPTVDKIVEEGDTLQALAIKYHCSVAELKRINNIHKENEIFAKRIIKVPHRPFTLALAGVHSGNSTPEPTNIPLTGQLIDIESLNTKLTVTNSKDNEVNEIIFNSQITQKQNDRINPEVTEENCDEAVNLLPQNKTSLVENDPIISRLSCNGADADISWKVLIACIVLLIVAFPLIYVFYIAEHLEYYHHHHGS